MKDTEPYQLPDGWYASCNANEYPRPANCVEYATYDVQAAVKRFMAEHHVKPKRVWFDEHKVYIPKEK